MRGFANFSLHGRCGRDAVLKVRENNDQMCSVPVVANIPYKKRGSTSWDSRAVWFHLTWFGDIAGAIYERLKKGVPVVVNGDIDSYEQEIGGRRLTSYVFRPRQLSIIEQQQNKRYREYKLLREDEQAQPAETAEEPDTVSDDEIPFE